MKRLMSSLLLSCGLLLMLVAPAAAGFISFPARSLIVPMDPCWQPNTDPAQVAAFRPTGCDADKNDQGLYQAYGMVYEILRSGANVAWVVRSDKLYPDEVDFSLAGVLDPISNSWVPPAKKVDRTKVNPADWANIDPPARTINWTTNTGVSMSESFNEHVIDYRGGPFVIHEKFLTPEVEQIIKAFSNVKVHYSNVSFTAPIDKVLDKVPPKLAILGSGKVDILRTYLQSSGLLGLETLVFNEVTTTEIIEDILTTEDADGNKYSLFWAPHWVIDDEIAGPVTLSNGTTLTAAEARETVLAKLRAFMEAGNSAFLECASIESIEGSEDMEKSGGGVDDPAVDAQGGWITDGTKPGPRLYTDGGLMDKSKMIFDKPSGFLTQCAGWTYVPEGGHVHNFKPHANVGGLYNNTLERFVHDPDPVGGHGYDYYTGGRINGSPSQGYATYLGGHQYLKCSNTWTPPGGAGTPVVPVAPPPDTRTFNLTIGETLAATDQVDLSFYYVGSSSSINVALSPDGSLNQAGEDGVLLSSLTGVSTSASGGQTAFNGINLSNLSNMDHTLEKVVVSWPGSGGPVLPPACVAGGHYSALLESKNKKKSDKILCTNKAPGTDCNPGGADLKLKDYHEKAKWSKKPPKMQIDVTEFTDSFDITIYTSAGTALETFTLDLTGDVDLSKTSDFTVKRDDQFDLRDGSGKKVLYVKFKEIKYKFNGDGSFNRAEIKIDKISRDKNNNDDVKLHKIVVNWGCSVMVPMAPQYTLYENGAKVAGGDNGVADPSVYLILGKLDTGTGGTGTPETSPTIDPSNISYCDFNKNNTCGTRFVLNTILGLQFTVITNTYVQSSPILDRGVAFQGSYEFPTFRGHLQAISVVADSNGDWDPTGAKLWDAANVIPEAGTSGNPASITNSPATRYIFTTQPGNNGPEMVEFETASVTQSTDYLHLQMGQATIEDTQAWINTVRGRAKATSILPAGEEEQSSRLWGIRTSSPAVVGLSKLANQATRDRIVYAGGDDGMLHAFYAGAWDTTNKVYSAGTGTEIWAYIPSTLLPSLQNQDYVDPNMEPAISVSGSPAVRDFLFPVKDGNGDVVDVEYRTLLLGTATVAKQNRGLVFCLDVTDPYSPEVLWETDLSSYNIGDARGVALGKVRMGDGIANWAFLTANYHEKLDNAGQVDINNGKYGINALALDALTGAIQWKWHENYAINSVATTPAMPSLLDYDTNGVVDYMVFGDMDGRVWQIDAKGPVTVETWDADNNLVISTVESPAPVYSVEPVKDAGGNIIGVAPIGSSIALFNNMAIFGTGGTDFAGDNLQYGLYALTLADDGLATLAWQAGAKDTTGSNDFLVAGEKIWGAPMIDAQGRIYVATGKGYQEQASSAANAINNNTSSAGRVHVLDKDGELLATVATQTASVGSIALTDGGAVATDFTGNMIRLDNPTAGSASKDIRVKVFSWRLR